MEKKPFEFTSIVPDLDWFSEIHHTIKEDDYTYFRLERRYGPSWWLIGMKSVDKPNYHWEDTEIGEIRYRDLMMFIEWAKTDYGSKIVEIKMISGCFDIFDEVGKLSNEQLTRENEKLRRLLDRAVNGLHGNCKECSKRDTCTNRKGRHDYCWEWRYKKDAEISEVEV